MCIRDSLILVLPDEYAEKLDIYEAVYVADTEKKSAPEDYENLCRIIAVSYTHLDVYKRQANVMEQ